MIAAPKTLSTTGPITINSSDKTGLVNPAVQIGGGALPTIANCASMNAKLALKAAGVPGGLLGARV